MHLLYGDFFALYNFNNQSINQSAKNILDKRQYIVAVGKKRSVRLDWRLRCLRPASIGHLTSILPLLGSGGGSGIFV
jgi:hypothetical protein